MLPFAFEELHVYQVAGSCDAETGNFFAYHTLSFEKNLSFELNPD
jgi:hypothetical protein